MIVVFLGHFTTDVRCGRLYIFEYLLNWLKSIHLAGKPLTTHREGN